MGQWPPVPKAGERVLVGLGYILGEAELESPPSSGSSASASARIGDRQPLNVEPEDDVREWRSVQVSYSSPPMPTPPFAAGLPCSGEPCIAGPAA